MRILFVLDNYSKYFSLDNSIRQLYQRGHEITLITSMDEKRNFPDEALQKAKSDLPNLSIKPLLKRRHWRMITRYIRESLNYAHVLNHEATRKWDAAKWSRFFHPLLWRVISSEAGKKKLKDPVFQKKLRAMEEKIPVDTRIKEQIKQANPDIVLVSPLINPDSRENEYVKASRALGIHCIYSMYSWDNIASKGTLHSLPDYTIVWNRPLALELTQLHNIPQDRIFIAGVPRFDSLFGRESIFPRAEFCKAASLDSTKPYVLYVCSTYLVNNEHKKEVNESEIILDLADALQKDPKTKDVKILVRPHPVNAYVAKELLNSKIPSVSVYPANCEFPDTEERRNMFYNSIYHSLAVVGVNTSAFLEASALDKPCVTILTEKFKETQMLPHFHHLSDANFLETANGATESAVLIRKIADGIDAHSEQRHEFVRNFLRPCGIDKPAAEAYAELVERIASQKI